MNLFRPAHLASLARRSPGQSDAAPIFSWRLRRDVLILISLKLAVLGAIYALFFAPHSRPEPRPAEIAAHLLDH
jgi:hypothetical protein